jgi:hypothetical protein
MKEILLTCGKVALVDDDDFELLSAWAWQYNGNGYAYRTTSRSIGRRKVYTDK